MDCNRLQVEVGAPAGIEPASPRPYCPKCDQGSSAVGEGSIRLSYVASSQAAVEAVSAFSTRLPLNFLALVNSGSMAFNFAVRPVST
jgi:hypothetical protein